jgi:hypothetical protein
MEFEHHRDGTGKIKPLYYACEALLAGQPLVFKEVHSAEDYRAARKQVVSVVEQEVESIIIRADYDIKMATVVRTPINPPTSSIERFIYY